MGMGKRTQYIVRLQGDGINVQDVMEDKGILQGPGERTLRLKDTKGIGKTYHIIVSQRDKHLLHPGGGGFLVFCGPQIWQ